MTLRLFGIRLGKAWLLGVAFLFVGLPGILQAEPADEGPAIQVTLVDGTGRRWGFTQGDSGRIYTLDEHEKWQPIKLPGVTNRNVWSVDAALRADGTIICLWKLNQEYYQCSEHRGDRAVVHSAFRIPNVHAVFLTPRLFSDSKGGMWLTAESPDIYRLTPEGTAEHMYRIPDAACLSPGEAGGEIPNTSPISVVPADDPPPDPAKGELGWGGVLVLEDMDGRLWFWTNHADYFIEHGMTIRGAILFDGKEFVPHDLPVPGGKGPKPLSELIRKDARHFWMGREGDGLYVLDTTNFQAERAPQQPPEASSTTFAVQNQRGDWLFVMGTNRSEGACTVCRLSEDGRWERIVDGVDSLYYHSGMHDRPWVQAEHGSYLSSSGNGLWYIPDDHTAPIQLDWRIPFRLTARQLVKLPSGRWLGWNDGLPGVGTPDALEIKHAGPDNPRLRVVSTPAVILTDPRGHQWTTYSEKSHTLREWDGEQWLDHPLPEGMDANTYPDVFKFDAHGRVWVRTKSSRALNTAFDPADGLWYQPDLSQPGGFPGEPGLSDVDVARKGPRIPPHELQPPPPMYGFAKDNEEGWWLIREHELYRYRDGFCVPVFAHGEIHPASCSDRLEAASVDAAGNAFLVSDHLYAGTVGMFLRAGAMPRTTLAREIAADTATAKTKDRVLIRLITDAPPVGGRRRFRWRLDGGPWTPLSVEEPTTLVTLENVPGGPHRMEAQSYGSLLQTEVAPAVLPFDVDVDPAEQVAKLIAQLGAPDYSQREAAVAALARQPGTALPALKAARTKVDQRLLWWIDAAIQKAEEQRPL